MRELMTAVFTYHGGFRIDGVATDGIEAALMAAELQPDVVVLDVYMPRWDGPKAIEVIHATSPSSRIVAFSAVSMDWPEWAACLVMKTEMDQLVHVVEELAHRKRLEVHV